jgi:histidinol-phosphatase (PHP family)
MSMKSFFPDSHTHTHQSKDSDATMGQYCERAISLGVDYLAFTDHIDLDPLDVSYGYYDFDRARREFEAARAEFRGRIELAFGAEVSCQRSLIEDARKSIEGRPYDLVIGSIHILDGMGGDISSREGTPEIFQRYGPRKIMEKYLDELEFSVDCGLFDVMGHIGIPRRHGMKYLKDFDMSPFEEQTERIARKMAQSGVALEVNASGLWQGPGETYPAMDFVKRFMKCGGTRITVGSDAHGLANVGRCVPEALEALRKTGVTKITVFRNRRPHGENICGES